jgi:hypothetical protein
VAQGVEDADWQQYTPDADAIGTGHGGHVNQVRLHEGEVLCSL